MARSLPTDQPSDVSFDIHLNGQSVRMSYQQTFALGHKLWLEQKYEAATKIFEKLGTITDRGPRSQIMLAHCYAMQADYASCCQTLSRALPPDRFGRAGSDLHLAFVMWKCGLFHEVKDNLKAVIAAQPNLPTPYLLLADLLVNCGATQEPVRLFQAAIEHDRKNGAIALIAQEALPGALERLRALHQQHKARSRRARL